MKPSPNVETMLYLAGCEQATRNDNQEAGGFRATGEVCQPLLCGVIFCLGTLCGHYYESSSEIGHSSVRKKKKKI